MSRPDDANPTKPMKPAAEASVGEELGSLAQRLREFTDVAALSFTAMKDGGVGLHGATSAALASSLAGIRDLLDRGLADVRLKTGARAPPRLIALDAFIEELRVAAHVDAQTHECELVVEPTPPGLLISGDKPMLNAAVSILLQNAFRYTRPRSTVWLSVSHVGGRIQIEVEDQCGGFPAAHPGGGSCAERGLSIVRRAIEANAGTLALRNVPGCGCTMSIDLPAVPGLNPRQ